VTFPARVTDEFTAWWLVVDEETATRVAAAVEMLEEQGPTLGRPLVGRIELARQHGRRYSFPGSLLELRVGSVRILFTFDANRTPVLLLATTSTR
jgi:hypothetical protein